MGLPRWAGPPSYKKWGTLAFHKRPHSLLRVKGGVDGGQWGTRGPDSSPARESACSLLGTEPPLRKCNGAQEQTVAGGELNTTKRAK